MEYTDRFIHIPDKIEPPAKVSSYQKMTSDHVRHYCRYYKLPITEIEASEVSKNLRRMVGGVVSQHCIPYELERLRKCHT